MRTKAPPSDPFKEQLRKITWLLGDDRESGDFVGDVVHLVQVYVSNTNKVTNELRKKVAMLEAELKEARDAATRIPATDETGG